MLWCQNSKPRDRNFPDRDLRLASVLSTFQCLADTSCLRCVGKAASGTTFYQRARRLRLFGRQTSFPLTPRVGSWQKKMTNINDTHATIQIFILSFNQTFMKVTLPFPEHYWSLNRTKTSQMVLFIAFYSGNPVQNWRNPGWKTLPFPIIHNQL